MIRLIGKVKRTSLVLLVLAGLLLGGAGSVLAETTKISFWAPLGAAGRVDATAAIIDEFHREYPHIEVEIVNVPGFADLYEKTLVAIAAGTGPDVVKLRLDMMPSLVQRELALDLSRYVSAEDPSFLGDFYPPLLESVRMNGGYYGLPINSNTDILYYNQSILQESGFAGPPGDFGEWVEMSRRLTNIEGGRIGTQVAARDYLFTFLFVNGGDLLNSETRAVTVNDPIAVESLEFMIENLGSAFFPAFAGYNTQDLRNGDLVMRLGPPGTANTIEASMGSDHPIATSLVPAGRNGRTAASWGHVFITPSSSAEQDAAWALMRFLYRPEINATWHRNLNFAPARISTMRLPEFAEHWAWSTFAEQLQAGRPLPRVPGTFEAVEATNAAIAAGIREGRAPADILNNLAVTLRGILSREGI